MLDNVYLRRRNYVRSDEIGPACKLIETKQGLCLTPIRLAGTDSEDDEDCEEEERN